MGKMKELYILAQDLEAIELFEMSIKIAVKNNYDSISHQGRDIPLSTAKAMLSIMNRSLKNIDKE